MRIGQYWLGIVAASVLAGGCATTSPTAENKVTGTQQIGNLVVSGVPPVPEALQQRLQQYENTRSAAVRGWVGKDLLVTTRFADTSQLHLVASPGGAREQITFFREPVTQAYPPPGRQDGFVYARDTGGSEFYQLFWFDWATAASTLLTDGKSRYSSVVWDHRGEEFAYTTTERNGSSWDIHIQNRQGDRRIALENDSGAWSALDWSPDDARLLVSRYDSISESAVYELDINTGVMRPLLDESLKVSVGAALYSADGKGVYFTSDLGAQFMRLHFKNLVTGKIEVLTADIPWDVEEISLAPDGKHLALTVNEDGESRLSIWRVPQHTPLALPDVPAGVISSLFFADDSKSLAFSLNRPNAPTDAFSIELAARSLTRWTRSEVGGLNTAKLSVPKRISFPTFDRDQGAARQIPAYLYQPPGPGPHPVVVSIHGGPEGQYRPYFSPTIQFMVNELGIAVIAPNVRGSSGYGKSYLQLDNDVLREDSVKDIGALLQWIAQQPQLAADRVAVMGGSYGGYMVLASLVHYSDQLAAGVESVGISNFVTFLNNTQDYRRDLRRAEYGDERDPAMRQVLEDISPLNHVEKIKRPLLISQGANDPRVPASESAQIRDALAAAEVPVWYILALDEGHGFRKKFNRDYYTAAIMLFLEEYLTQ